MHVAIPLSQLKSERLLDAQVEILVPILRQLLPDRDFVVLPVNADRLTLHCHKIRGSFVVTLALVQKEIDLPWPLLECHYINPFDYLL